MASKYWIGNEPSSDVTSAQAQKIAAAPAGAITDLTDSTGGAVSDTCNDTSANTKDDLASIIAKVNGIIAALRAHGIVAE
tara:strand:- start:244 stop:483 length:240 start_codon:yes stop_codon:yes gene_type:complete